MSFENIRSESKTNSAEQLFRNYLEDLRLTPEDLRGKYILDVGSGNNEFARIAQKYDARVVGVDAQHQPDPKADKTQFVSAAAEMLPFQNGVFDLTISRTAFPMVAHVKYLPDGHVEEWRDIDRFKQAVQTGIAEILRVTKETGEVRLGPIELYPEQADVPDFMKNEKKIILQCLEELKNDPRLQVSTIPVRKGDMICVVIKHKEEK